MLAYTELVSWAGAQTRSQTPDPSLFATCCSVAWDALGVTQIRGLKASGRRRGGTEVSQDGMCCVLGAAQLGVSPGSP